MKILLATPNFHQQRGNTVTVRRIADRLKRLGVQPKIISTTDSVPDVLPAHDIVHGFHARRFFKFKEKLAQPIGPYVITMTGTDLNHDLFVPETRHDVLRCLEEAAAIHVFDEEAQGILNNVNPSLSSRVFVIHQGTEPFAAGEPLFHKENDSFLFFLPAGIRKVKNIPIAIELVAEVHRSYPHVRLLLAGPILEDEEGAYVQKLVSKYADWITYTGAVPHENMGALYQAADVVLNTSLTEGQPAAILEAMQAGLPVLASSNHGNRSIIKHDHNGLIYETSEQFCTYAAQLIENPSLRKRLGLAARNYVKTRHSSSYEAKKLLNIYEQVLRNTKKE